MSPVKHESSASPVLKVKLISWADWIITITYHIKMWMRLLLRKWA